MNILIDRTRKRYRSSRIQSNYSIFDIENIMILLAKQGTIWCIQDMEDLTETEAILIGYYLNKFKEKQVYDFFS